MYMGLHNEFLILQHSQLNPNQFEAHHLSLNLRASMCGGPVLRFETVNVLKCQLHVCFNDEPKSCLSVSSDDRQSIKGHHPKYNSYTDLLSVLMLLC